MLTVYPCCGAYNYGHSVYLVDNNEIPKYGKYGERLAFEKEENFNY